MIKVVFDELSRELGYAFFDDEEVRLDFVSFTKVHQINQFKADNERALNRDELIPANSLVDHASEPLEDTSSLNLEVQASTIIHPD